MSKIDKQLKENGFTKNGMTKVAFCLESLDAGQNAYTCIFNTNAWLIENFGTDFSLFFHNMFVPCITPMFGRYYIEEISNFSGHIICSTVDDVLRARNASMSKIYFYIQDLYEIRDFNKKHQEFLDIMYDQSIIKFARSADIRDHYRKFGFNILDKTVEDYNIKEILEIVNG